MSVSVNDFENNNGQMLDCIHLKACRRLQKIARNYYKVNIGRKCDDTCTAYCDIKELIEGNKTYTRILQKAPVMYDLLLEVRDTVSDALPLISDKTAMNELLAAFDLMHELLNDIQESEEI